MKFDPNTAPMLCFAFLMNAQSAGSVTLRSADPRDAPVIHLGYCEHPYDRMVLVRALREAMRFCTSSSTKLGRMWQKYVCAPRSESEEDILVSPISMPCHLSELHVHVWHGYLFGG